MKRITAGNLFGILVLGVLLVLSTTTDAMGQGRGRRARHFDKKCEKFVNCHDARDGRWDGRGRNRRAGFTNIFRRNRRERDFDRFERRRRDRDRDFSDSRWRRRRR